MSKAPLAWSGWLELWTGFSKTGRYNRKSWLRFDLFGYPVPSPSLFGPLSKFNVISRWPSCSVSLLNTQVSRRNLNCTCMSAKKSWSSFILQLSASTLLYRGLVEWLMAYLGNDSNWHWWSILPQCCCILCRQCTQERRSLRGICRERMKGLFAEKMWLFETRTKGLMLIALANSRCTVSLSLQGKAQVLHKACQRLHWLGVADWNFGQDSANLAGTIESLDSDLIFLAMQFPLQVFLGHSQSSMSSVAGQVEMFKQTHLFRAGLSGKKGVSLVSSCTSQSAGVNIGCHPFKGPGDDRMYLKTVQLSDMFCFDTTWSNMQPHIRRPSRSCPLQNFWKMQMCGFTENKSVVSPSNNQPDNHHNLQQFSASLAEFMRVDPQSACPKSG